MNLAQLSMVSNFLSNTSKIYTILHLGKGAPTISILKPYKDYNIGTAQAIDPYHFYHPLPSTRESVITINTENIPVISYQYGF